MSADFSQLKIGFVVNLGTLREVLKELNVNGHRWWISSDPHDAAETGYVTLGYGNFSGHANGHPNFWRNLQLNKIVPQEVEYDEVPRGRVGYQTKERKFYIFLDPCILANEEMVDRIRLELNLPSADTIPPMLDAHYHCPGCKKKSKEQLAQEEADWDF